VTYRSFSTELVLILLTAGPQRITALTAGLTPAQLRTTPADGEWSALEVLAHLRSCADVWGDCIALIIAQNHPTIRAVNPRNWVKRTDYPAQEFQASLQAFSAQRSELLKVLSPLPPAGWSRTATVTDAGNALERSVHFYAQWLAGHERTHFKQLKSLANTLRV